MKKALISLIALICSSGGANAGSTEIVSLDPNGGGTVVINGQEPRISANGRSIVFRSTAYHTDDHIFARIREPLPARSVMVTDDYLGSGIGGRREHVFEDLVSGQTALSENGRFAAFVSNGCDMTASHLCFSNTSNTSGQFNIYRRDLELGETVLVSPSINDGSGNHPDDAPGDSYNPHISADGRWIAYESYATDLEDIPSPSGYSSIWLRDLDDPRLGSRLITNYRIESCPPGNNLPGNSFIGDMTPDGRFIVFVSNALPLRDCVGLLEEYELFVWDRENPTEINRTGIVVNTPGVTLGGYLDTQHHFHFYSRPSISDDGRFIAFIEGNLNVYDRVTQSTLFQRGTGPGGFFPIISGNGTKVAFENKPSGSANHVYVLDVASGSVELASQSTNGAGDDDSFLWSPTQVTNVTGALALPPGAKISRDGRFVAFNSYANNLSALDVNSKIDVYVRDALTAKTRLASETPTGEAAVALNIELDATGTLAVFQALSYFPEDPSLITVVLRDMRQPTELIVDLKQDIVALNLRNGVSNSLDGKMSAVDQALSDARNNNDVAAIAALEAFILTVEAQRGINLTNEEADQLVAVAQTIINLI